MPCPHGPSWGGTTPGAKYPPPARVGQPLLGGGRGNVANVAVLGAVIVQGVGDVFESDVGALRLPSNQPASRRSRRCAAGVLPEITRVATGGVDDSGTGSVCGACSMTTWALVPPNPKDETPARRARPMLANHVVAATTSRRRWSNGICGFGCLKCRFAGIAHGAAPAPVLMKPAMPAAASR